MGYRNYIGRIPRVKYLEVKDMMEKDLLAKYGGEHHENDEDTMFDPHSHLNVENLYECGKQCDDRKNLSRFFTNEMSYEGDTEFWMAGKELLLEIIESYRQKVVSYYNNLLQNPDSDEAKTHFHEMMREWDKMFPYSLNVESPKIVDSWKYEYEVFELVRILKTFDWENDVLVYYGY